MPPPAAPCSFNFFHLLPMTPFNWTRMWACSAFWMTCLLFWISEVLSSLLLNIPHILAVPNPVHFHVFSSLLAYYNPTSDYQCHLPYLCCSFLTGPLLPLLTPIVVTCCWQSDLKIQLRSASKLFSSSTLRNEKNLHCLLESPYPSQWKWALLVLW